MTDGLQEDAATLERVDVATTDAPGLAPSLTLIGDDVATRIRAHLKRIIAIAELTEDRSKLFDVVHPVTRVVSKVKAPAHWSQIAVGILADK